MNEFNVFVVIKNGMEYKVLFYFHPREGSYWLLCFMHCCLLRMVPQPSNTHLQIQ